MGIKDLWTILTPFCERKPLFELQGKTVAIDLSGWVCQAQCITEYQVQPKMYLRNLYFRTCYLLMLGVNPVFVLEGAAPTLKHKTIQSRNAVQFKGAKPRTNPAANVPEKGRTRFHHILKQCELMLKLMGLSCITAVGEAEAMCAYLNEKMVYSSVMAFSMVDGCISQDSDCFAYGAKVVYRNFSISQQGVSAASGGSVDVYDLAKAEKAINFGRQKVIALSLICGSDYNEGVFGVGKEAALKLFSTISNEKILDHIREWRNKESHYEKLARDTDLKYNCSSCGHSGNKAKHTRSGCIQCDTSKGCTDLTETNGFAEIRNELNIRKKALQDEEFPDETLISEFLIRKDKITQLNLCWKKPDMTEFIKFTVKHLQWEDVYCFQKLFPILTRWIMLNPDDSEIKPKFIKKKRNPKGVCSYEIIWDCECFNIFIQEENDELKLFSSIEPLDLVENSFPELVSSYKESQIKPKSKKKKKEDSGEKKKEGAVKKTRKKKVDAGEKANKGKQLTLTQFVKTVKDLDASCFGDEDDDVNLSLVIENIVLEGVPNIVESKLQEIRKSCIVRDELNKISSNVHDVEISDDEMESEEYELNTCVDSFLEGEEGIKDNPINTSHFFGDVTIGEPDLFEKTFNAIDVSSSSESEDSFDEEYVPLLQRIQNKQL